MEYTIRKMKPEEVRIATDWAEKEGWNPGLEDARCFYEADREGFFVGLVDGEPVATGAAVIYDDYFAFCGLYIVKPEWRSHGYGMQLTEARLKYVGNRMTGIDGVLENVEKYKKIGYVPAHKNIRYELANIPAGTCSENIVPITSQDVELPDFKLLDRRYFPAKRNAFLNCWLKQGIALGYKDSTIRGYGVIRRCYNGYKIGPLFAENGSIAEALFLALCSKVKSGPIYLDIPEVNKEALGLVTKYKMKPMFEVIRMYRNGKPKIDLEGIFGFTTFEIG